MDEDGINLRNFADTVLGAAGVVAGAVLLVSNPVGWAVTISIVTTVYGTATAGYDIYNEINDDY